MKKQYILRKFFVAGVVVSAMMMASCGEENGGVIADTSINGLLADNANYSTLSTGIRAAGLTNTLTNPGAYTMFAPNNAAFSALGITSSNISAVPGLNSTLLYHTLTSKILVSGLPTGPNAKVIAANGDSVFITNNTTGAYINGIRITEPDMQGSNGVVHGIGRVLVPAFGNIIQTAQVDTSFKLLVQAVVKCNLQAALSASTIYTVFAPTNTAFRAAGYDSAAIANASPATVTALTNVLNYHVLAGRSFAIDYLNGINPTMLNGSKTLINSTAIKGISNPAPSNITRTNILARNGVIHVIDRVLLP